MGWWVFIVLLLFTSTFTIGVFAVNAITDHNRVTNSNFYPGTTLYYYVHPLPDWADYAENTVAESVTLWEDADPNLDLVEVSAVELADFQIAWVKDFGELHLGYALGGYVEIGLGDSQCRTWQPFHPDRIVETIRHELGHVFGLEHTDDPSDLMYPEAPFTQYLEEVYEFYSTGGYLHFLPLCSGLDVTSYDYTVEIDDSNEFDVYFVASRNEYDTYSISGTLDYYQDKGCFAEDVTEFRGSCSGISNSGGLILSMPDQTDTGLVQVYVSLKENIRHGSSIQQDQKQKHADVEPDIKYDGIVTLKSDAKHYEHDKMIVITGKLDRPSKGARINVLLTDPIGQTVSQLRLITTSTGDFEAIMSVPDFHPSGQYTVSAYNDDGHFLGDLKFTTGASLQSDLFGIGSVEPSDLKTYRNSYFDFSIQLPKEWDVDDSYVDPELGETFDLVFYPMIAYNDDSRSALIDVQYYLNDELSKSSNGQGYLDDLIQVLRDNCDLASMDVEEYTCSNFFIVDSKIMTVGKNTAYQITASSVLSYPDGSIDRAINVVTDIPRDGNVWSISALSLASDYPRLAKLIHASINSFIIS